jgi:NADPH:quinone reductase-like Zn-dependent oxidoreductase
VSFEAAAAVPTAGVTALQALRDDGALQAGEEVLVHGASGGVGTFAVQLAMAYGADVTGVCSTVKVETVREIGAAPVLDYTETDVTAGERRYDVIVDTAADHSLSAYRGILREGGRYVMVGGPASRFLRTLLFGRLLSMTGSKSLGTMEMAVDRTDLATVVDHLADGTVSPVVDRTVPLRKTPAAIEYLESGRATGKVVISVGESAR